MAVVQAKETKEIGYTNQKSERGHIAFSLKSLAYKERRPR